MDTSPGSLVTTLFQSWWLKLTTLAGPETQGEFWNNPAYVRNALLSDATGHPDPACTTNTEYEVHSLSHDFRRHVCSFSPVDVCVVVPLVLVSFNTCLEFAAAQLNSVGKDTYKGSIHNVKSWGLEIHQAEFKSQLLGTTPLGCFADRYTPHGGDESTVRCNWVLTCWMNSWLTPIVWMAAGQRWSL